MPTANLTEPPKRANLTEPWLEKRAADPARNKPAALPGGVVQERWWHDRLPGFGVVIGKRFATFVVKYRENGRQRLETIGRWRHTGAGDDGSDVWTVERAYKRARVVLGQIDAGIETRTHRRADSVTLRQAFEAHKAKLAKKVKAGERSQATIDTIDKTMARKELQPLLDRPLAELDSTRLDELHAEIKSNVKARAGAANETGAPVANRVIANISAAWSTMNKKLNGKLGIWNPARGVDKDELLKGTRKRVDNLADWYARVQTMRNPIQRDGLVFTLFTGLRHEDVRTVRFSSVDEDVKTLRLPDPKGGPGAAFTIPLPKTCLEIIERRRKDNARDIGRADDPGEWAFPGLDAEGEIGPIGDLRQQVHKDGKHARFPAEDVHTLRRTYLSVAAEAGVSELDQHVLSNHSFGSRNVNATYIAQHIDHLAKCQAKIEAALWERIEGKSEPVKRGKRRAR